MWYFFQKARQAGSGVQAPAVYFLNKTIKFNKGGDLYGKMHKCKSINFYI